MRILWQNAVGKASLREGMPYMRVCDYCESLCWSTSVQDCNILLQRGSIQAIICHICYHWATNLFVFLSHVCYTCLDFVLVPEEALVRRYLPFVSVRDGSQCLYLLQLEGRRTSSCVRTQKPPQSLNLLPHSWATWISKTSLR